jgi:hypothetical protein
MQLRVLTAFAAPRSLQDLLLNKTLLSLFSFILPLPAPKLSTLCYAHAAPRQPEQLPDYTLMHARIGCLAILQISTFRLFVH